MNLFRTLVNQLILEQADQFNNWKMPDENQLKLEFKVEQVLKRRNWFKDYEDFLQKVESGQIISVNRQLDNKIGYRSQTQDQEELLDLISSYASYPEFRNEDTLQALYDGYSSNKPVDLPIVLKFPDGGMRIFSGNTRMDVAFHLGIEPKVLLVEL